MNKEVRYKRNVYFIIAGVMALAIIVQLSRSEFVLEFSRNTHLSEERTAAGAEPAAWGADDPLYCVAYASDEPESDKIRANAVKTLDYMKKQTAEFDVTADSFEPESCGVTIVAFQHLDKFAGLDRLLEHVEQGAYAMFAGRLEQDRSFYRIYRKLGIVNAGSPFNAKGIKLVRNVLFKGEGTSYNDDFMVNFANSVEIDGSSELLAESGEGIPLMWKREYGQGAFMLFNGTMLQEKINRGMLAGGLSLLEPDFIYPIFNVKQMYIDDFPSPVAKGINDNIYADYGMDIARFYREIWWPDMLKAAKRTNTKFTAVLIQSYNDRTEPPFQSPVDEDKYNLISYGREVIKSGGELGIHGYNHQSLQLSQEVADYYGYKPWPDSGAMASSIEEVLAYAGKTFPEYKMLSYVPPSNMMDEAGREALKKAWPDLMVIASLYEEDATNKSYVQEFEVADDGIIEMPRITSGYMDTEFELWAESNTLTSLGVFSHFVHPDDILDDLRRKDKSWKQLYEGFEHKLSRLHDGYPWLRPMTATEGAIDMEKTLAAQVTWTRKPDALLGNISSFGSDMYFIFRTDRPIGRLKHCKVTEVDTGVYLVRATESAFEIGLGG